MPSLVVTLFSATLSASGPADEHAPDPALWAAIVGCSSQPFGGLEPQQVRVRRLVGRRETSSWLVRVPKATETAKEASPGAAGAAARYDEFVVAVDAGNPRPHVAGGWNDTRYGVGDCAVWELPVAPTRGSRLTVPGLGAVRTSETDAPITGGSGGQPFAALFWRGATVVGALPGSGRVVSVHPLGAGEALRLVHTTGCGCGPGSVEEELVQDLGAGFEQQLVVGMGLVGELCDQPRCVKPLGGFEFATDGQSVVAREAGADCESWDGEGEVEVPIVAQRWAVGADGRLQRSGEATTTTVEARAGRCPR